MKKNCSAKLLTILFFFFSTSACNEYWWTRGQPPAPNEVLKRAQSRILENKVEFNDMRPDITKTAEKLVAETNSLSTESLPMILTNLESSFLNLEGKLSYGNRPPFNELSSQLRTMIPMAKKNEVPLIAAELYLARVLFFLSTEMKVPAPDPVKTS